MAKLVAAGTPHTTVSTGGHQVIKAAGNHQGIAIPMVRIGAIHLCRQSGMTDSTGLAAGLTQTGLALIVLTPGVQVIVGIALNGLHNGGAGAITGGDAHHVAQLVTILHNHREYGVGTIHIVAQLAAGISAGSPDLAVHIQEQNVLADGNGGAFTIVCVDMIGMEGQLHHPLCQAGIMDLISQSLGLPDIGAVGISGHHPDGTTTLQCILAADFHRMSQQTQLNRHTAIIIVGGGTSAVDATGIHHALLRNHVAASIIGKDGDNGIALPQAGDVDPLGLGIDLADCVIQAQLMILVASPSPDLLVRIQRQNMVLAHCDLGNIGHFAFLVWHKGKLLVDASGRQVPLGISIVAQLTLIIATPSQNGTIDLKGHGEAVAAGNLGQSLELVLHIHLDHGPTILSILRGHTLCFLGVEGFAQHIHRGHAHLDPVGVVLDLAVILFHQRIGHIFDQQTGFAVDLVPGSASHGHVVIGHALNIGILHIEGIVAVPGPVAAQAVHQL